MYEAMIGIAEKRMGKAELGALLSRVHLTVRTLDELVKDAELLERPGHPAPLGEG